MRVRVRVRVGDLTLFVGLVCVEVGADESEPQSAWSNWWFSQGQALKFWSNTGDFHFSESNTITELPTITINALTEATPGFCSILSIMYPQCLQRRL